MTINSTDEYHFCSYASQKQNGCSHVHQEVGCTKCGKCFTFFTDIVEKFIKLAATYFSGSNYEEEVNIIKASIPLFQTALIQYTSHLLRAKVQFSAIKNIKQRLKTEKNVILVVIDLKQKILPMAYREGQVDYFGKKGMSLLGAMIVQWKEKFDFSGKLVENGFEHNFIDTVVGDYTGQDHVQVAAVIEILFHHIRTHIPGITEINIESDNASCFASQNHIPFILHLNEENKRHGIRISRWIFTEAQTGKGVLDTHFSYLNVIFMSYVEDGNVITVEEDIFNAIKYRNGLAGTTALLLNAQQLHGPITSKKFTTLRIGSRATHDIMFYNEKVAVKALSNLTIPEIILKSKLDLHRKLKLDISVRCIDIADKPGLFMPNVDSSTELNARKVVTNKN